MADELFSSTGREKTYEEIEEGPEGWVFYSRSQEQHMRRPLPAIVAAQA